jgi:hypothetical protein
MRPSLKTFLPLLSFLAILLASTSAFSAASIVIQNADPAGVGFNDATPVLPTGENPGTTLGQQRLNAFQYAANLWGATLNSNSTITISASWQPMPCSSDSAVLGGAGAASIWHDFSGARFGGTWYSGALANALAGFDLDPGNPEIQAAFNSSLGSSGCLAGTHFYLGLDNNHGSDIDLVSVLLHEFSHGFGFQTFTNASTGSQPSGLPSVYDHFLFDNSMGKTWVQMSDSERQASALNNGNLAWNGQIVTKYAHGLLATPRLQLNSPNSIAGKYQVGTATFGPGLSPIGLPGSLAQVFDAADAAGPSTTDACSTITNPGAVAGKIAFADRGTCPFVVKAKNAQNAGAIGLVVADNVPGNPTIMYGSDPSLTIPTVRITQADGDLIKSQLSASIKGSLMLDQSAPSGADSAGRVLMYAPNPFQEGSSVSHWDISVSPNLLMEPDINGDLSHSVNPTLDLTASLMRDIGWPTSNPIDQARFFVQQHYTDFLNRDADSSGLDFWTNEIVNCGSNGACIDSKRSNVSAAFYLSIEFQETGYLVYRMYKSAFGNLPGAPVPVRFGDFIPDTQLIGRGVAVGIGDWQTQLNNNKQSFAVDFVSRERFTTAYPTSLTPAQFVDALFENAQVTPSSSERAAIISEFGGAGSSSDVAARARVLRLIADNATFANQEKSRAFVLMQYFGYLRRNPNDLPDSDFSGYNYWLNKLNEFHGNYIDAEMVRAFSISGEYRQRFGP